MNNCNDCNLIIAIIPPNPLTQNFPERSYCMPKLLKCRGRGTNPHSIHPGVDTLTDEPPQLFPLPWFEVILTH